MNEVWERVVVTAVAAVIAACVGLFVRVRQLESKRAAADIRLKQLEGRGTGSADIRQLRDDLSVFRDEFRRYQLEAERRYLSREEWVPANSRILGALEKQGQIITRIDENLRLRERHESPRN